MHSLWFLPAVLLAVPLFAVWRIRRYRRREFGNRLQSVIQPTVLDEIVPKFAKVQTRTMKWISIGEFMTVLTKCSDLIVIDLRADAPFVPFPVPSAFVLPVMPSELVNVLEWLPCDRTVVFCGASDLCILMISTSRCMEGSAPLYVPERDSALAEVA